MGRSLVTVVPGMRSNAPKRNTIVLLVYLVFLLMAATALRRGIGLDVAVLPPA